MASGTPIVKNKIKDAFNASANLKGLSGVLLKGTIKRFVMAHETIAKIVAVNRILV